MLGILFTLFIFKSAPPPHTHTSLDGGKHAKEGLLLVVGGDGYLAKVKLLIE